MTNRVPCQDFKVVRMPFAPNFEEMSRNRV